MHKWVRPEMIAEIKKHQAAGRTVAILTGNLEPLVLPFCESLGCVCIATKLALDPSGTVYTGGLLGEPNLSESKVQHVKQCGHIKDMIFGYGNSKSDIPFLSLTGNPYAVNPGAPLPSSTSHETYVHSFR